MKTIKRFFHICFVLAAVFLLALTVTGAAYFTDHLPARTIIKNIPIEIVIPEKPIIDQIKEYSSLYNIPWQIPYAVHLHETGNGRWFYRFEPGQMSRAAKVESFPEEQRALASSHGPMHVMGLTAKGAGLHWTRLYTAEGVEFGVKYLADPWNRFKQLPKEQRLRRSIQHYNPNDPNYPNKVLAVLAVIIMDNF